MPTVNLGPCACCGGSVNCCEEIGDTYLPDSIDIDFSSPQYISTASTEQQNACAAVLQEAGYTLTLAAANNAGYTHDHGAGSQCFSVQDPNDCNHSCVGVGKRYSISNSGNAVGGRLHVACIGFIRISGIFQSDSNIILSYWDSSDWASLCNQSYGPEKWRFIYKCNSPQNLTAGYVYNTGLPNRISKEITEEECDNGVSQLSTLSFRTQASEVIFSRPFGNSYNVQASESNNLVLTALVTMSFTYLP